MLQFSYADTHVQSATLETVFHRDTRSSFWPMTQVSTRNFGLLIAYVVPGLVVVSTMGDYSQTVRSWFGVFPGFAPTVAGFLYTTLASVAAGMTVGAIRWLLVDWLHHNTGIERPEWDFSALQANYRAFAYMVESHYRYYQFYGNMLVALVIAVIGQSSLLFPLSEKPPILIVVLIGLLALFYVASRDALRKYYAHTTGFLGSLQQERKRTMTNGSTPKTKQDREKTTLKKPSTKSAGGKRSRETAKGDTPARPR